MQENGRLIWSAGHKVIQVYERKITSAEINISYYKDMILNKKRKLDEYQLELITIKTKAAKLF
jgi:hypothetical protein